jgi:EAL domain-containing protein (putative c-di-GMP-specific phosphodiesterase class I)
MDSASLWRFKWSSSSRIQITPREPQSFGCGGIHADPDDLALTTAIIAMAYSLGIIVVAEGVEKEGQYAILRERGCDLAQGYWLGHPSSAQDFARLLI